MRVLWLSFAALQNIPSASSFVSPTNQQNVPIYWGSIHTTTTTRSRHLQATVVKEEEGVSSNDKVADTDPLLKHMTESSSSSASSWSEMFGLSKDEANFYALFDGIRNTIPIGLRGKPFVLKKDQIEATMGTSFDGYFSFQDLEKAVDDDFLDAGRGSTDNRKGWKMTSVSNPRGQSFEDARMTFTEVQSALEKGTVIFNSAGAHIPKLAGAALACTDATSLPNALNMYVTTAGKRTSAPPHTDKQDVLVVQTEGSKHWRVYSPPGAGDKPMADMFTRGKGDDNLPFHALESDLGCELLLETTLREGDVLFIPAAFPHTTDTSDDDSDGDVSIHLTFGIDTHIWGLDYLSLRRLAMRRGLVQDTKLGQNGVADNPYVGNVNLLPEELVKDVMGALPFDLLDDNEADETTAVTEAVLTNVKNIAKSIDEESFSKVEDSVWEESTTKTLEHGKELLEIHRDMYVAAVEEGRTREIEAKMTAHLDQTTKRKTLTPEQMQRLSVFRVKRFFDQIDAVNKDMLEWSYAGHPSAGAGGGAASLPENWQYTLPVSVGDEVEADLGGAFFPARVTKVDSDTYDVQFFDGDQESGLDRSMIKLVKPPAAAENDDDVDTSQMTKKELKRWKKEQEKKKKHGF